MIALLIVDKDGTITVKEDTVSAFFKGSPPLYIVGRGQPPRKYITSWVWEEDGLNKEEIRIYVSEVWSRETVLSKLTPIFESVKTVQELLDAKIGEKCRIDVKEGD